MFRDEGQLLKAVRVSLVEAQAYKGMPFMFLCHLEAEDNNTLIEAIKMGDWEHDAEVDVETAVENGWVFCRTHQQAYDHAVEQYRKLKREVA